MRKMKKITAILLSALMLIGMFGMVANAANPTITKFEVTKELEMDPMVKTYPAFQFKFSFKQVESFTGPTDETDLDDSKYADLIVTTGGPTLDELTIDYTNVDATTGTTDTETGRNVITQKGEVKSGDKTLDASMFPSTGLYLYEVTENTLTKEEDWNPITENDWLKQSEAKYIMVIPVVYDDDAKAKKIDYTGAIILKTVDHDGTELDKAEKVSSPMFENVYQRDPDEGTGPSNELKISKTVTGNYGDKQKAFKFTIKVIRNTTEDKTKATYEAKIYNEANVLVETKNINIDKETEFTLTHGQYLVFEELPVGSKYTIKEDDNAGYVTTATIKSDGLTVYTDKDEATFEKGKDADGNPYDVGEGENSVAVTNDRSDTVLTGIVTDNLSFILLIVVAVAGMTAYAVMKRRLRTR